MDMILHQHPLLILYYIPKLIPVPAVSNADRIIDDDVYYLLHAFVVHLLLIIPWLILILRHNRCCFYSPPPNTMPVVLVAVFNVDVVSASDDKSGDSSSSFYQSVLPLSVFKLFLCSHQVAAADNDVVDYTSMLSVMLYLLPSMDRVLFLLFILYLSMTLLPPFALSLLVLVFVDDNDYDDEYDNSSGTSSFSFTKWFFFFFLLYPSRYCHHIGHIN